MKTEDICKLLDKPVSTCTVAHVLKKKINLGMATEKRKEDLN